MTASSSLARPATVGEDSVELSCAVEANPPASLVWRRLGSRKVLGAAASLLLDPVTAEDGGDYTCEATNELGSGLSLPVRVDTHCEYQHGLDSLATASHVSDPPAADTLTISTSKAGPLLDSEDSVRLSCAAEASPAPELTWLRARPGNDLSDLELVTSGPDLVLAPVTKEDRGGTNTVTLDLETCLDKCKIIPGVYICIASNDLGFVNKTFSVDVMCKCHYLLLPAVYQLLVLTVNYLWDLQT